LFEEEQVKKSGIEKKLKIKNMKILAKVQIMMKTLGCSMVPKNIYKFIILMEKSKTMEYHVVTTVISLYFLIFTKHLNLRFF